MLKKVFFTVLLLLLAGCSGHPTTMQDVSSFCRSLNTEEFCEDSDSVCGKYSEVMLAPYKSARECRMACEDIRMKNNLNMALQQCSQLMEQVEGKCSEFCNSNYDEPKY